MNLAKKTEKVKKNVDYYLKKVEGLSEETDINKKMLLKKRLRRAQRKLNKLKTINDKLTNKNKEEQKN